MKGVKHDAGKLRYDLIPWFGHQELARVFTIGAAKYGDNNWRGGFKWSRIIRALISHLEKWRRGEKFDLEDGQLHLSSVAWCAYVLMEFDEFGIGEDNRVKAKITAKRKALRKVSESIATRKVRKHKRTRSRAKRFSVQ